MQPPSFEDFMKKKRIVPDGFSEEDLEPFQLEVCPTPGCRSDELTPKYEDGLIVSFSCGKGCHFTAKRNTFNGDLIYFKLEKFEEILFSNPDDIRDMKFNPLGEAYTDWY